MPSVNPDIDYVADRLDIDPAAKASIVTQFSTLYHENNEIFARFKAKVVAKSLSEPGRKLSGETVGLLYGQTIQEVTTDQNFTAGYAACKTFAAVAVITRSKDLGNVVNFSKLALDFGKQLVAVQDAMALGTATLQGLANPVLGLTMIGFQIFSAFKSKQGPSFESYVLRTLQIISQQISELHKDMLVEFHEVHEHLERLHKSLHAYATVLSILIINQVQGMRQDTNSRLEEIKTTLDNLHRVVSRGNYALLTQDLVNECAKTGAIIRGEQTVNLASAIPKRANKLFDVWIINQAANGNLTGATMFVPGNTGEAHTIDALVLNSNTKELISLLGYLASVAVEAGLDVSEIDARLIMHPGIFIIAVETYLNLRQAFPGYFLESSDKFEQIKKFAAHTINFIRKIQSDRSFFNTLLDNYENATNEVLEAIAEQVQKADQDFQSLYDADIKLSDPFNVSLAKFNNILPEKCTPEPGVGGYEIVLKDHPNTAKLSIEPLLAMARKLKLVEISCSYTGQLRYPAIFHGKMEGIFDINFLITHEPFFSFQSRDVARNDYLHGKHHIKLDIKHNFVESGVTISRAFPLAADIRCYDFSPGIAHNSNRQQAFNLLLPRLDLQPSSANPEYDAYLFAKTQEVKGLLTRQRKTLIVKALLERDNRNFNKAIAHLSSAKARLLAFASLAGVNPSILQAILNLPDAQSVQRNLEEYNPGDNLAAPYWQKPNLGLLKLQITTFNIIFNSKILAELEQTLSQVSLCQTIHANTLENQHLLPKTKKEKLMQLGLQEPLANTLGMTADQAILVQQILDDNDNRLRSLCRIKIIDLNARIGSLQIIPLHLACYLGSLRMVKALVELNILSINVQDLDGFTPLMYAVISGNVEIVRFLKEKGADTEKLNAKDKSAATLAAEYGNMEIYEELESSLVAPGMGISSPTAQAPLLDLA